MLYVRNNVALFGVLLLFASNLIFSFEKFKSRIFFLLFNLMIFVFLLSRPTISMIKRNVWWYFKDGTVNFSLTALFISLLFLQIGAIITEQYLRDKKPYKKASVRNPGYFQSEEFVDTLQKVTLILFYVTIVFFFAVELEKLIFMHGKNYEQFYVSFQSNLPYIVRAVGSMTPYTFCIFLATFPSKKSTFIPFALFILSAIPSLIIGMRNPIVLNILFALVYYFVRDYIANTKKWFGKFEKIIVIATLPAALLFLSAYNYIRAGTKIANTGFVSSIVDLFYKQGVSFDVLGVGYESMPLLPKTVPKNYTFGEFIDYLGHNSIAQKLFGAVDLGEGNSVVKAVFGNSFAHSMSYVSRSDYLQGHGWGTSYILDTFADYGYLGIILYSAILGGILVLLMYWLFHKSWFGRSMVLLVLTNLFFTPRAEALSSVDFIIKQPFWFTVIVCLLAAALCSKQYSFKANRKRRRDYRVLT